MSSEKILEGLNKAQTQAVTAPPSNILVVAGAGTGKTRVVVSRIAYILEELKDPPRSILALTFTNKAANELKERVQSFCAGTADLKLLWAGTFHSICARFLRSYAYAARLNPSFTILDAADQAREVKNLLTSLYEQKAEEGELYEVPPKGIIAKASKIVCALISKAKEHKLRAADSGPFINKQFKQFNHEYIPGLTPSLIQELYASYEQLCESSGCVDFDELLLRTYELFCSNKELRELQHKRFLHILVDEFQDTNELQYAIVRLLAGPDCDVMAVGDDDQSIYSWRGANYANMFNFMDDFKDAKLIALDQNYRSTKNVLSIANALLKSGRNRLTEKELVTDHDSGVPVSIVRANGSYAEAHYVVSAIESYHEAGVPYSDMAILYRYNAQSSAFEHMLAAEGISYSVFGGTKFYEREEVQNAVGYLRLAVNEDDNVAFKRIINFPKRAIGPAKVTLIEKVAKERHLSLFKTLKGLVSELQEGTLSKADAKRLNCFVPFVELIEAIKQDFASEPLDEALHAMMERSGLYAAYKKVDAKELKAPDEGRTANLRALIENARHFMEMMSDSPLEDEDGKPFSLPLMFSVQSSLNAGTEMDKNGSLESHADSVVLSTIHSAKGLEYPVVFVTGFEDGCMPSSRADEDEERRLAYVAITRAKNRLIITYCQSRALFGTKDSGGQSPFLYDIKRNLKDPKAAELHTYHDFYY